jgi:hypothetical protein
VGKFTSTERSQVKSLVAELSIKRIPESLIINEIFKTGKSISRVSLFKIKQSIKKESAKWYQQLRESQFEYIHAFKERIDEIMWLQQKHYEIVYRNEHNPSVQQGSLAALHKLNVTLSNYFDVAPAIADTQQRKLQAGNSISVQDQARTMFKIEGCTCPHDGRDIISHNKCRFCLCIWCPTALKQDWCPNPECAHSIKGCKFEPYDDLRKWVECKCGMWFKTKEIMDAHREISIACKDIIV